MDGLLRGVALAWRRTGGEGIWWDHLLRPARVVVAKAPEGEDSQGERARVTESGLPKKEGIAIRMAKVIGIDLGTTNSCVAIYDRDPVVVSNSEGARTTPSIIAFTNAGEKLVGQIAKRQAATNPEQTIYSVKRLIGRKRDSEEVERFAKTAPFAIEAAENGDAQVRLSGRAYSPQAITAMVLAKMKETASDFAGEHITDVVITVPAHFDDAQRQATKDAGKIAGLNVLRIINEPTAAALAYGIGNESAKRIAFLDLGGGMFDISILDITDDVFAVRSTNGDRYLGGEDFDIRIAEHLIERFETEEGIDLRQDKMAFQRIKEASELAKNELSSTEETEINLPFIAVNANGPLHLAYTLERGELETLVEDLVERLVPPCRAALVDAKTTAAKIDEVVLVGGMTRMPLIVRTVEKIFGRAPSTGVNPDEVVAIGAAIQGGVLTGKVDSVKLLDVTPLSLGIETHGGVTATCIARNTTIPARKRRVFTTTDDAQSVVRFHVVQGEREMAADNMTLGCFELVGISSAARGVPQIEVTFDIDADGVVNVSATDLDTGLTQAIQITLNPAVTSEL